MVRVELLNSCKLSRIGKKVKLVLRISQAQLAPAAQVNIKIHVQILPFLVIHPNITFYEDLLQLAAQPLKVFEEEFLIDRAFNRYLFF